MKLPSFSRKNIVRTVFLIPTILLGLTFLWVGVEFYNWRTRGAEWYEAEGDSFLYRSGIPEYSRALANYLKSEELDSGRISIHQKLGNLYLDKGIFEERDPYKGSMYHFQEGLQIDSQDEISAKGIMLTHFLMKETERAIEFASEYAEADFSADFFATKGRIELFSASPYSPDTEGRYLLARDSFEKSLQREYSDEVKLYFAAAASVNNFPEAQNAVEDLLIDIEDQSNPTFQSARAIREVFINYGNFPDGTEKFFEFGRVFYYEGFPSVAIAFLDRASESNTEYAPAYFYRGLAALDIDNFQIAKGSFETVVRLQPFNSEAIYFLAKTESMGDRPEDSLSLFESAIRERYMSEDLFYDYGMTLFNLGRERDAREKFQQALLTNPAHFETRKMLVQMLIEEESRVEALSLLEESKNIFPGVDGEFISDYLSLIVYASSEESARNAVETADKLLSERSPEDLFSVYVSYIYFYRGMAHENLGNETRAIEDYFRAIDLDFFGDVSSLAEEKIAGIDIPDESRDFWWWVREIL